MGLYVGVATVGIFIYWFTSYESADGHTLLSFEQLSNFSRCPAWENFIVNNFDNYDFSKNPCLYFTIGKRKAMTLSLSVLVVIEMLNSLNAISEDGSLVQMPPWVNTWLLLAISGSLLSHAIILYVPFLAQTFGVVSLTWDEWVLVVAWSIPVIFIDEILKAITRYRNERNLKDQLKKAD